MTYNKRNCLITGLIGGGLIFSLSAILTYLVSPHLVKHIVQQRLVLSSPEVDVYEGWRRPPIPIYTKIYIFNVTNPDDIVTGKSGPILKELGPYVFLEKREKINISWNHQDGTVSYHQIKRYHPLPEQTVGSLKDKIVHLNVPLASMIHQAKKKQEDFLYNFIEELTTDNADGLFLTHTVGELLFDGYQDELLSFINGNGLSPVPIDKFGFFYERNGTITDGLYSIYTGENGSIDKFGTMSSWNNHQSLPFWNSSFCNKLESTWPGDLRPPYPDSNPTQIKLFTPDICRWLSLKFLTKTTTLGVETIRYMADPKMFDYTLEENKCYCTNGECPANGIFVTSLCTHGSPSSISFPHFLFADPVYTENIQGLHPDQNKHAFLMDIEPTLGIPVVTLARLQVNILLEKDERLDLTTNLKESTYIPMFWFETSATIGNETIGQIKLLQQQVPHFIIIGTFIQIALAVTLLIATLIYILKMSTIKELVPRPNKKQYKNVMTTSFQS